MKVFRKGNTLVSTILNIIGLTFAFAALYIIIVQVHYDFTYNKGIKESNRIYVLACADWFEEGKYGTNVNRPTSEEIIREFPLIERGGLIEPWGSDNQIYISDESQPINIKTSIATLSGLETIGYELIEGSWKDWKGTSLAISESMATNLGIHAGDHLKLGSTDFYSNQTPEEITVAAIYKDLPRNSDFSLHDAIYNFGENNLDNPNEWGYKYFVKFNPDLSEKEINSEFYAFLRKNLKEETGFNDEEAENWIKERGYRFFPIQSTYYNPILRSPGLKGNKATTFTLLAVAILIIIIAFINYINFFFALIPIKLRDINTRKILGSSRKRLIASMICESLIFVMISLGLGAILVVIFSHSPYSNLISTSVLFKYHWGMTFITIGAGIIIAFLSSVFPAIYITSFNPAMALRGFMESSSKGNVFRNGLIGFQFTISIILVVCAIVINQQRNYLLNSELGFDKENLLTVEVSPDIALKPEIIESRLKEDSSIKDITWADGPIVANGRMGWGREFNGEIIHFETYPVAWNFLQFMNIPIVEGRDFVESDSQTENGLVILNEEARIKFGIKIGDRFPGHMGDDHPAEVIGFARNFNYMPLREKAGAFCFYQFGKYPWRPFKQLYVRTNPNVNLFDVKENIINILSELDHNRHESLWDVQLLDESIENLYSKEENLSKLINLFTLLAIVISLMGVFGLVMFDTERRKKEIGVRRVNGATVQEILGMFNMKFIKIIIVSFIIAIPLSLWLIRVYLESYAYKTPIYIWVFFVALLSILVITTGVVTLRSYKAATANPVNSLRSE
ncbi:MAG: FtsX-like permease family protein [Muribaculaceae bacterium]|nr:FtsX-like permease family protein [Muribaculaceae bacterium]